MAYDFHYTPTGTGVISGKEVLEQTEDAINDLGTQISGDVQTAIDTANNALNTANTASADAQNAVNTAYTAYTAATNAQNTANAAQNTASNALTAAQTAQNDVDALENVVTGIDGRLTTTEGNITNLQGRMTTAEGNIGNLQTAVSTAQATANSAQQTATTARQQSYVFRYSSTALVASSTNSNALLDNTDNLKVGDKVIDSDGVLFSITAIDSVNSTFTVGSALVDLALDANVVHTSGNETVGGVKTFSDNISTKKIISNVAQLQINARSSADSVAIIAGANASDGSGIWLYGKDNAIGSDCRIQIYNTTKSRYERVNLVNSQFLPTPSGEIDCGGTSNKWKSFNGINPGALSLPDLRNGIDISSYITNFGAGTVNEYTPVADGWISIANSGDSPVFIRVYNDYGFEQIVYSERNEIGGTSGGTYTRYVSLMIPCIKNIKIYIIVSPSTSVLVSAKFYPCQGNV